MASHHIPYLKWINQPIFVSSTFLDMQVERDFLRDIVFPELQEKLRPHRIALELIDLRWGVDTISYEEDHLKEIQILKVCLDEIDRSRPFLLALIGNRYGWIPPVDRVKEITGEKNFTPDSFQKSMTALETEYALLHSNTHPAGCFFYFRSIQDLNALPVNMQFRFSDESDSVLPNVTRGKLLEEFKRNIRRNIEGLKILEYKFHVANLDKQRTDLDHLRLQLLDQVYHEILHVHQRSLEKRQSTWQDDDTMLIDDFVSEKSRVFEGRVVLLQQLSQLSSSISTTKNRLICITGGSGSGKSALVSKFIASNPNLPVIKLIHFAGIGPRTVNVDTMLERWIYELVPDNEKYNTAAETSGMSYSEIRKRFHEVLLLRAKSMPVLILVDALDQFERSRETQFLTWIPDSIPPNVLIITTSIPGNETHAVSRHESGNIIPLSQLNQDEAVQIMNAICERHHKSALHQDLKDIILGKRDFSGQASFVSPLWLSQMLEQLLLLDEDDFAKTSMYQGEGDDRLHQLMLDVVKVFPADSWDAYAAVFARTNQTLERLCNITWVPDMLEHLALSRFGLREEDLKQVLSQKSDFTAQFAIIRRYLRSHLVQRNELGLWFFAHRQARDKVLATLSTIRRKLLNNQMLTHFEKSIKENELAKREIMFYYYTMSDYDGAAAYLMPLTHNSPESQYVVTVIREIYFETSSEGDTLIIWLGKIMNRIIELQDEVYNSFDQEIRERAEYDEEQGTDWAYWVKQERKNTYITSRASVSLIFSEILNTVSKRGESKHVEELYKLYEKYMGHTLIEEDYLKGDDTLSVIEIRVLQAIKLAQEGNKAGAIAVFEELLEKIPFTGLFQESIAFVLVRVRYAVLLFQYGDDLLKAITLLNAALDKLEELHAANGERGIPLYGKLIVETHFYFGEILNSQGKFEEAHSHFQECLVMAEHIHYENLGSVLSSLGRLLFVVGQYERAKVYLQQSIVWNKEKIILEPDSHETRYNLSNQYFLLGMIHSKQNALAESLVAFEEGRKRVREALQYSPQNPLYLERISLLDLHLDLAQLKLLVLQHPVNKDMAVMRILKIQEQTRKISSFNKEVAISLNWFYGALEQDQKWEACSFCLYWCVYFYNESFTKQEPNFGTVRDAAMAAARLIKMDLLFNSPQDTLDHIRLAEHWNSFVYQQQPNDDQVLTSHVLLYLYKGEYFLMQRQIADARIAFRSSKDFITRLIQLKPEDEYNFQILQLIEGKLKEVY